MEAKIIVGIIPSRDSSLSKDQVVDLSLSLVRNFRMNRLTAKKNNPNPAIGIPNGSE